MLFHRIEWMVTRVARVAAGWGIGFGLIILTAAIIADVLMRWLFNSPITGVRDASGLFVAVISASFFSLLIRQEGNITIRLTGRVLGMRVQLILDIFSNIITWLVMLFIVVQLWKYADYLADAHETTQVLGWSMSPWWRAATLLIGLSLLTGPVTIWEKMRRLWGHGGLEK